MFGRNPYQDDILFEWETTDCKDFADLDDYEPEEK